MFTLVARQRVHEARQEQARRLLEDARRQWGAGSFRSFVRQYGPWSELDDDDAVMNAAIAMLTRGSFLVLEELAQPRLLDAPEAVMLSDLIDPGVPTAREVTRDWIAIVVLDEAGDPVADEPYVLHLPDGAEVEGRTDADGRARHEAIARGSCRIVFPRASTDDVLTLEQAKARHARDAHSETPAGPVDSSSDGPAPAQTESDLVLPPEDPGPAGTTWLVLEAEDADGLPLRGRAFVATLADGSEQRGTLDESGRLELTGISTEGPCQLMFEDQDLRTYSGEYATGCTHLLCVHEGAA